MNPQEKIKMANDDGFLDSPINENNAEYNILYAIREQCGEKNFLLQIFNLSEIKDFSSSIVSYIICSYKSYELTLFSLHDDGQIDSIKIDNSSGNIDNTEFLINKSQEIARENSSYVLVNCSTNFFLVCNGKIAEDFKSLIENKNSLKRRNDEKFDINHLEEVFDNYKSHRHYNGCSYIKKVNGMPKVIDNILEQTLRNDLLEYLKKKTKLFVIHEFCTSLSEDEESVDLALVNEDNEVAIIEIKFFVERGFFVSDSHPAKYSFNRFLDGYKQLNRYCIHLDSGNNYKIRYIYLYMFYAHSKTSEQIKKEADACYNNFLDSLSEKEIEKFRQYYRKTIFDNMIDIDCCL